MITGNDESITQEIRSRQNYTHEQVLRDHQFVDVLSVDENGRTTINYDNFNLTAPSN